jgi:hypothetical protein
MLPSATTPNHSLLVIECGLTAIATASAFAWPRLGNGIFGRIERTFARLARKKVLAAVLAGLSVLILRLAILPIYPIPLPFVPDDFSFLLAAETFAHGRLTNPTPAMWMHFESIHITMLPTYQSMYFPGQGLLLAAGQVVIGHPWFALLVMDALMCACLTWMLQAWLPANWALLGGCIAVIRLGLFSDWINTYHTGGSLAALGGALVLGALPRLKRSAQFRYGLLMAIGIAMMALTRPYEGLLLCIPVAVTLGYWVWKGKSRPPVVVLVRRAAVPLALILAAIAWLGYYDYKAFGSPTTLPYTVNRNTYAIAPYYVWQEPRPEPDYRHPAMRAFYEKQKGEMGFYTQIHSLKGFLPYTMEKVVLTFLFYAGFIFVVPLIMVRRVFLDKRVRFLVVCTLVLAAGMVIEIYLLAHYVAPFTAAFYAIGLQAMRHLRVWKPEGKPSGQAMVRFLMTVCVLMAGVRLFAQPLDIAPPEWPPSYWNFTWYGPEHFGVERAQIEARLERLAGEQLVIVRYGPDHNPLDEWVYNEPNIDGSKVVWARDMGAADNLELIRHYSGRKVWLAEPDAVPARITPYPMPDQIESGSH